MSRTRHGTSDEFLSEMQAEESAAVDVLVSMAEVLTPVAPPQLVLDRVMEGAVNEGRFYRFAAEVAEMLRVDIQAAQAMLDTIQNRDGWVPLLPQIEMIPIDVGPDLTDWHGQVFRIRAGATLPSHTHLGRECSLIMQGTCIESAEPDVVKGPSDHIDMTADTEHSIYVCPGPDLLFVTAIERGVTIGGTIYGRNLGRSTD